MVDDSSRPVAEEEGIKKQRVKSEEKGGQKMKMWRKSGEIRKGVKEREGVKSVVFKQSVLKCPRACTLWLCFCVRVCVCESVWPYFFSHLCEVMNKFLGQSWSVEIRKLCKPWTIISELHVKTLNSSEGKWLFNVLQLVQVINSFTLLSPDFRLMPDWVILCSKWMTIRVWHFGKQSLHD